MSRPWRIRWPAILGKRALPGELGLALGGGAARGIAHIGVIKVIQERKLPITAVAGTSAGSIFGALFCAGLGWQDMYKLADSLDWGGIVSLSFPRLGLLRADKLERTLDEALGGKSFAELDIPFAAVSVDILNGKQVVLREGRVARAVRASCSVPGIFEPVEVDGQLLVDGGLMNDVPADVVKAMGPRFAVGVNLNSVQVPRRKPRNTLDVLYYTLEILVSGASQVGFRSADMVVAPPLGGFAYNDLKRVEELVERGEQAMLRALAAYRRRAPSPRAHEV